MNSGKKKKKKGGNSEKDDMLNERLVRHQYVKRQAPLH